MQQLEWSSSALQWVKKANPKLYILYDSIYIKLFTKLLRYRKDDYFPEVRDREKGRGGCGKYFTRGIFVIKLFCILIAVMAAQMYTCDKITRIIHIYCTNANFEGFICTIIEI